MNCINPQVDCQIPQFEASIDAVGKRCQVLSRVLFKSKCIVTTRKVALQVPQNCVYPLELWQVAWLELVFYNCLMNAVDLRHRRETRPSIEPRQSSLRSPANHLRVEAVAGTGLRAQRDGRHERHLVLKPQSRWKLSIHEHGASDERSLMAASTALERLAGNPAKWSVPTICSSAGRQSLEASGLHLVLHRIEPRWQRSARIRASSFRVGTGFGLWPRCCFSDCVNTHLRPQ